MRSHRAVVLLVLGILGTYFSNRCSGHRILSLFLVNGRSNLNYFEPIHLELAKRGHSITVITPNPCLVKHENIKEYPGLDFAAMVKGATNGSNFFHMRLAGNKLGSLFAKMAPKFAKDCDAFHQLPVVQKLIAGELGEFDLVMTYGLLNECVYGLFHHLNASSVVISTMPAMFWLTGTTTGSPTPLSFVPNLFFDATEDMDFVERMGNVLSYLFHMISRDFVYNLAIEAVYQKYIPHAPGIKDVERNFSLVMCAGHPSFGPKRPTMPDLIDDLGGLHCRPAMALPKDVQKMITDTQGQEQEFVFFSFGSIIQSHLMPVHIREGILKAFAKFPKYRFLWKWETDWGKEGIVLPENVRFAKWFPQQDLLGHTKCRLFITHGGLSSIHESIYHRIPVLGIPFFTDQDWNMRQVENHGIGETLELQDVTEENMTNVLKRILENPKYKQAVLRLSERFQDRQIPALERAVWNLEYVLRHGGATHLRSPARHLNLLQYYCVDVLLFFTVVFLALSLILCVVTRKILKRLYSLLVGCRQNKQSKQRSKSKKQ